MDIESNRLIAEFMGATAEQVYSRIEDSNQSGIHIVYPRGSLYPNNCNQHPLGLIKYHSSWDWLMPVVRKLVELSIDEEQQDMFLSEYYDSILDTVPCAVIEDSYRVVVEFINYYNKLKQQ